MAYRDCSFKTSQPPWPSPCLQVAKLLRLRSEQAQPSHAGRLPLRRNDGVRSHDLRRLPFDRLLLPSHDEPLPVLRRAQGSGLRDLRRLLPHLLQGLRHPRGRPQRSHARQVRQLQVRQRAVHREDMQEHGVQEGSPLEVLPHDLSPSPALRPLLRLAQQLRRRGELPRLPAVPRRAHLDARLRLLRVRAADQARRGEGQPDDGAVLRRPDRLLHSGGLLHGVQVPYVRAPSPGRAPPAVRRDGRGDGRILGVPRLHRHEGDDYQRVLQVEGHKVVAQGR
mmetsp:Transcript_11470/g.22850  ORF Transcript_11470/g.22850 Transcript_11470/m.22850 type:complete len:280 (+) Transcript_11470:323-1162(+)